METVSNTEKKKMYYVKKKKKQLLKAVDKKMTMYFVTLDPHFFTSLFYILKVYFYGSNSGALGYVYI